MKGIFTNWKTTTGGGVALLAVLVMAMGQLGWIALTPEMSNILMLVAVGATGGAAVASRDHNKTSAQSGAGKKAEEPEAEKKDQP